jgi:hypothetical protein
MAHETGRHKQHAERDRGNDSRPGGTRESDEACLDAGCPVEAFVVVVSSVSRGKVRRVESSGADAPSLLGNNASTRPSLPEKLGLSRHRRAAPPPAFGRNCLGSRIMYGAYGGNALSS